MFNLTYCQMNYNLITINYVRIFTKNIGNFAKYIYYFKIQINN